MDQKEHIHQFNRQLDRLLSGKALDTHLSLSDQRGLELARHLSLVNFSSESSIRDGLYLHLLKSSDVGTKPTIMCLLRLNFSAWAWTALVLIVLLVHTIEISSPYPTFIAPDLPEHVVMHAPSRSVTNPSWMTGTQALKPVPVPTPLAISAITHAQNQPSMPPISRGHPASITPAQTQTPKPEPLPRPGARP